MTYTLWSRGRLLGHSDLGYARVQPLHRMGTLVPTEEGERLLPVASGVSAAIIAWGNAMRGGAQKAASPGGGPLPVQENADLLSALDERDALGLILCGPDGHVIPTEWIDVRDCAFMQSQAEEANREADAAAAVTESGSDDLGLDEPIDDDLADLEALFEDHDKPWLRRDDPAELPEMRYQLSVMLLDESAIP